MAIDVTAEVFIGRPQVEVGGYAMNPENDPEWIAPMEQAAAELRDLGGDVSIEIIDDEGHIISTLGNGLQIFDDLDDAR